MGDIYNPLNTNDPNCGPDAVEDCAIGDLSSKHGQLTLSGKWMELMVIVSWPTDLMLIADCVIYSMIIRWNGFNSS